MTGGGARRRILTDLLLLGVGALLLNLPFLGARDLWNPNEPLYGRAVVEMAEHADWVVPTVNGEVFPEKPILYFWMARLASTAGGGVSELTLRLPSAVAGVAGVLLLYLLVQPYAGRPRARLAAILFGTTYIVMWSSRQLQMDLLLTVCCLAAILVASRRIDHGMSPAVAGLLGGASAGAGFLAKGPVALIVAGLTVAVYAVSRRSRALLSARLLIVGVAAFLIVAAPWPLLVWSRGESEFLVELFYRQNVTRFVAPWDHDAPWWYYLVNFWIDMAPWAFLLPLAFRLSNADGQTRRLDRLAWIWIVVVLVFFSLSSSKRSPYIMPLAPAVAILVSRLLFCWSAGSLPRGRARAARAIVTTLGLILAGAGLYAWMRGFDAWPQLGQVGRLTALLLVAGGATVATGGLLAARRPLVAPVTLLGFLVALNLFAAAAVLPAVDAYKSARPFSEELVRLVGQDEPLRSYWSWKWRASYSFYAERVIPWLSSEAELRRFWTRAEPVFLLTDRGSLEQVLRIVGPTEPLAEADVGSNRVYLLASQPAGGRPDSE